jgi:hypothetical protein
MMNLYLEKIADVILHEKESRSGLFNSKKILTHHATIIPDDDEWDDSKGKLLIRVRSDKSGNNWGIDSNNIYLKVISTLRGPVKKEFFTKTVFVPTEDELDQLHSNE